ncbi:MAG: hypothetical protein NC452_02160 [Eubacterium sp.]|nr:hypothetical protein [Eubacterium sp.]
MAQTRYNHFSPIGSAGGIVDLSPYSIDTFNNEEETGKMKFGVGVFRGANAGKGIKLPASGATAAVFFARELDYVKAKTYDADSPSSPRLCGGSRRRGSSFPVQERRE